MRRIQYGVIVAIIVALVFSYLGAVGHALPTGWVQVSVYPQEFGNPYESMEIRYNAQPDCSGYEDFPYAVVDEVHYGDQTAWGESGVFHDDGYKPKEYISFTVEVWFHCEDWSGWPDYNELWLQGGAEASPVTGIAYVSYDGVQGGFELGRPTAVPWVTNRPCPYAAYMGYGMANGFIAPAFYQVFTLFDGWDDAVDAMAWENVYPDSICHLDSCFECGSCAPSETYDGYTDPGGRIVDAHLSIDNACCDVCSCWCGAAAYWEARGEDGYTATIIDQSWEGSCFEFVVAGMWILGPG